MGDIAQVTADELVHKILCLILGDVLLSRANVITTTRELFTKFPLLSAAALMWSNSSPRRFHKTPPHHMFPKGYHIGFMFLPSLQHPPLSVVLSQSRTRGLKARRVTQRQMADAAVGGGNCTPTILATADAGQIRRGRGPDLEGTVGTLNGLLERTHSMINSSLNAGARSSAESPESKTIRKFGTVASRLEGLYKVRGMHVDQIVSTATIDNAIAKLENEL